MSKAQISPPSPLGNTRVLLGEELLSGHSRKVPRCFSGFWQSTEEKRRHIGMYLWKRTLSNCICMCPASGPRVHHCNLVTNRAHAKRGHDRTDSYHCHVLSPSFNTVYRQHTLAAVQGFRVKAWATFIFRTLFQLLCYSEQLNIPDSKAPEHE